VIDRLVPRLGVFMRAVFLCLVLIALLLQTYGLYIASALIPPGTWRRRLNFQLRRAMFTMDHMRLTGWK
jgi:hypothetical protein